MGLLGELRIKGFSQLEGDHGHGEDPASSDLHTGRQAVLRASSAALAASRSSAHPDLKGSVVELQRKLRDQER